MADKRITKGSVLWSLAKLTEAGESISSLGVMPATQFLATLGELAPGVIRRELDHIDRVHRNEILDGLSGLAFCACYDAGRTSGFEDGPLATDEDAISWLCESRCTAQVLADLARLLEVEPPDIVKRALARLESETPAA